MKCTSSSIDSTSMKPISLSVGYSMILPQKSHIPPSTKPPPHNPHLSLTTSHPKTHLTLDQQSTPPLDACDEREKCVWSLPNIVALSECVGNLEKEEKKDEVRVPPSFIHFQRSWRAEEFTIWVIWDIIVSTGEVRDVEGNSNEDGYVGDVFRFSRALSSTSLPCHFLLHLCLDPHLHVPLDHCCHQYCQHHLFQLNFPYLFYN